MSKNTRCRVDSRGIRLPTIKCPTCGAELDAASHAGGNEDYHPSPEDLSICYYCTEMLIYNADMTLRVASVAELEALHPDDLQELIQAREYIRSLGQVRQANISDGPPSV